MVLCLTSKDFPDDDVLSVRLTCVLAVRRVKREVDSGVESASGSRFPRPTTSFLGAQTSGVKFTGYMNYISSPFIISQGIGGLGKYPCFLAVSRASLTPNSGKIHRCHATSFLPRLDSIVDEPRVRL